MPCTNENDSLTQGSAKENSFKSCCGSRSDDREEQLLAQLSEERKRTAESKSLHAAFGEVVHLMSHSAAFQNLPLGRLEALVLPAIRKGQFAIVEGRDEVSKVTAPIAAMLWANVSEEVDRRLSDESSYCEPLSAEEWSSGTIPWLMLAIGDANLVSRLKAHVEKAVNGGRRFKYKPPLKHETYS